MSDNEPGRNETADRPGGSALPRYSPMNGPDHAAPGDETPDGGPAGDRLAPRARRVLAFVIDLAFVTVVVALPGGLVAWLFDRLTDTPSLAPFLVAALAIALGLAMYTTTAIWLTEGQTPGKAVLALAVRRLPDQPPQRDLKGLAWTAARSSVGYLVIDVLGIGMVLGLVTPGRRCPHDHVFGSQVVLLPTETGESLKDAWMRLKDWNTQRQAGIDHVTAEYRWFINMVIWLMAITLVPVPVVLALYSGKLGWLLRRLAGWLDSLSNQAPPANTAHATAGPVKAAGATATTALTSAIVAVTVIALSQPTIAGTWSRTWHVTRTGADAYTSVDLRGYTAPKNGCVFKKGITAERIYGDGPAYHGDDLWVKGNAGQNCTFRWGRQPSCFTTRAVRCSAARRTPGTPQRSRSATCGPGHVSLCGD